MLEVKICAGGRLCVRVCVDVRVSVWYTVIVRDGIGV